MNYKFDSQYIGYPPIDGVLAAPASYSGVAITPGFLARAEDAVFGPGEFIFGRANGAIRIYGLCVITPLWQTPERTFIYNVTECPNTANLGRQVVVAQANRAMVAGEYGWFLTSGITPINGTADVAAATTFGITAAGQVGANTAGKQILNATVVRAGSGTQIRPGVGDSGSDTIYTPSGNSGFFVGGYLSGTGVGSAAIVTFVDPLGSYIKASVVNSAAVNGNVTQTNNNATIYLNVCELSRSFAQGAIT